MNRSPISITDLIDLDTTQTNLQAIQIETVKQEINKLVAMKQNLHNYYRNKSGGHSNPLYEEMIKNQSHIATLKRFLESLE